MKGPIFMVLVAGVTLVSANTATAALFSDDFEGYLPDNPIHGQGGWAGWDNSAIAGAAPVSTAQAFSGSQSLEIGGPDTDLVQVFTGVTSGEWVFETMLYIPSGGSGGSRFIMLNGYTHDAGDPRYYATDIEFNLGSGTITRSGADGVITPDTWVNLRLDVDLDANTYAAFYGGEVLFTDATWASNGPVEIQALDLWAAGASPIYYDDVSLSAVPVLTWSNVAGTNKWNEANWSGATPPPPPPDAPNATIAALIGETSLASPVRVVDADASAYSLTMSGPADWSQVVVGADKSLNITTKLDAADGLNLIQLNNNATLNTGYGPGGLFLLWTTGNATVETGGNFDVAFFEDTEGSGGVLTKQGAGTLNMVNSDDAFAAAQTTFRVEQGTLTLGGTDPLGGSTEPVQLAGGTARFLAPRAVPASDPGEVTAGMKARFDASTVTGIGDGSPMASWDDSAPGADGTYNALPTASAPLWIASEPGLNGNSVVRYDATGNQSFEFEDIHTVRTVFFVGKAGTTTGWEYLMGDDVAYNFVSGDGGQIYNSTYTPAQIRNGTTELNGAVIDGVNTLRPTEYSLLSIAATGNLEASTISADRQPSCSSCGGRSWKGDIADLIIYDVALTEAEIAQMTEHLAFRYGLPLAQPNDLSTIDFTVTADSGLRIETDGKQAEVAVGSLRLEEGILTLSGAPKFVPAAIDVPVLGGVGEPPDDRTVGLNLQSDVVLSTLSAHGSTATIAKEGPVDLIFETANATLDNATLEARGGLLATVDGAPSSSVGLAVNGGTLGFSSTGADLAIANGVAIVGDGTLAARQYGSGVAGTPGSPISVSLNNVVGSVDAALVLRTADDYSLHIATPLAGTGSLEVAGDVTVEKPLHLGGLTLSSGSLARGAGADGDVTVTNALTLSGGDLDMTGSTLTTTGAGIDVGAATLAFDNSLSAASLNVSGGGVVNVGAAATVESVSVGRGGGINLLGADLTVQTMDVGGTVDTGSSQVIVGHQLSFGVTSFSTNDPANPLMASGSDLASKSVARTITATGGRVTVTAPATTLVTPPDGVIFWVDANDEGSFSFVNGNQVSTWTDKSAAARVLTGAGGGILRETDPSNGMPTVRFDGTSLAYMTFPDLLQFSITDDDHASVFVVARTDDAVGNDTLMSQGGVNMQFFRNSGSAVYFYKGDSPYPNFPETVTSDRVRYAEWVAGGETHYFVNGQQIPPAGSSAYGPNDWYLNRLGGGGGCCANWDGWISEVIIFEKALSPDAQDLVGGYLAGKYGLTTTYPPYLPGEVPVNLPATNFFATADATLQFGGGTTTVGNVAAPSGVTLTLTNATEIILGGASGGGTIVLNDPSVTGTVSLAGTLAPGDAVGMLTLNGDLAIADGSNYDWELGPADSDTAAVSGELALPGEPGQGWTLTLADAGLSVGAPPAFPLVVFTYGTLNDPLGTLGNYTVDASNVDHWIFPTGAALENDVANSRIILTGLTEIVALQWNLAGSGLYHESANWIGGVVPNDVDDAANFMEGITAPSVVTVDAPVTVGTMTFRNSNSYTIVGPAGITLETSGEDAPQINVQQGNHTILAPLLAAGGLTVDTTDGTGLTIDTATGYSVLEGTLTKDGAGSLALGGRLIVTGELNHNGGVLQVGPDVLAVRGGSVNVGGGATLQARGSVNRRVVGATDSALEAVGALDVGVLDNPDGYNFQGHLEVGPHTVGLKDADKARVYETHLAGGSLSSFNGIALQPVDVFGTLGTHEGWLTGHGTVKGAVRFEVEGANFAALAGDGPGQELVLDGVVSGSGWLEWVIMTGLHRPGASAGFTGLGQGTNIGPGATVMGIDGTAGFATPSPAENEARGYDQWFAMFGQHAISGDLTMSLESPTPGGEIHVPDPSVRYEIFKSFAPGGNPANAGWYIGWFNNVTLDPIWPNPTEWVWEFAYQDGGLGHGTAPDPGRAFFSATLMVIPEPGTLMLLSMGALALTLGRWRRRR